MYTLSYIAFPFCISECSYFISSITKYGSISYNIGMDLKMKGTQ